MCDFAVFFFLFCFSMSFSSVMFLLCVAVYCFFSHQVPFFIFFFLFGRIPLHGLSISVLLVGAASAAFADFSLFSKIVLTDTRH